VAIRSTVDSMRLRVGLITLLAALGSAALAAPAFATSFNVTTTIDNVNDANCIPTSCTLRQAINAATSTTPPGDSISVPAGTYTVNSGFGQLVTHAAQVTITGAGPAATILSGNGVSRVLQIPASATVSLKNLAITHGAAATTGGGINITGVSSVTLDNVQLSSNDALASGTTSGAAGAIGEGGFGGSLTIRDSDISGNRAFGGSGTFGGEGGAMFVSGTADISNTTINGNTAKAGTASGGKASAGAIEDLGTLTLSNSSITNNTAEGATNGGGDGGAIVEVGSTLTIDASTFSGNLAGAGSSSGGGNAGVIEADGGTINLTNSTISGNTAGGSASGAGVAGALEANGGAFILTNTTLAGNTAAGTGSFGGNLRANGGTYKFTNSIIAGGVAEAGSNCSSTSNVFTSTGRNLESADTCFLGPGDLKNTDPLLGPLADNGGPTQTRALPANSPAVDQAIGCPPPATDQRGMPRPAGGGCDLGAFEFEPSPANPPSNAFSFGKLKLNKKKGTAVLPVIVPGAGTLTLTGKGLVKQRPARPAPTTAALAKAVGGAGTVKLLVKTKGKAKRKLNRNGRLKVTLKVTFAPTGGVAASRTKTIKLIKRR
jgi:hypothetical protein